MNGLLFGIQPNPRVIRPRKTHKQVQKEQSLERARNVLLDNQEFVCCSFMQAIEDLLVMGCAGAGKIDYGKA